MRHEYHEYHKRSNGWWVILGLIVLAILILLLFIWLGGCEPVKPTPTPLPKTATPTRYVTPIAPTSTSNPTLEPTITFTPVPTKSPTLTPRPTTVPTVIPTPVSTKNYCWYNEYFERVVCYPRAMWMPAGYGKLAGSDRRVGSGR